MHPIIPKNPIVINQKIIQRIPKESENESDISYLVSIIYNKLHSIRRPGY